MEAEAESIRRAVRARRKQRYSPELKTQIIGYLEKRRAAGDSQATVSEAVGVGGQLHGDRSAPVLECDRRLALERDARHGHDRQQWLRPVGALRGVRRGPSVRLGGAGAREPCADYIAGQVLRGLKKPQECSQFGEACTPDHPLGAPMVSSEGACAAYYRYGVV